MKKFLSVLCLLLPVTAQADTQALQKAIEGKHRSEANVARDTYRNPLKTLELFDIQPHHTVVEVWPGGGWYTEILAPYLKKEGQLIAAHYDTTDTQAPYRPDSRKGFEKKMASNKVYSAVKVTSLMLDEKTGTLTLPAAKSGTVDRVVTFRGAHGMYSRGVLDATFAHLFDILKPGGKLGIVQHQADPHQDWMSRNIGYVGKDFIISAAAKAGFVLDAEGYFNNNPKDHKRYKIGVWQLPPSLSNLKTDEEKAPYKAIGESDRMTLVFVKPL
ncbi:class I SAM-dependent methyltransferase [Marinagarivorans algicola]|uniref:class I SAM-dependent methyltransferase n=1 Tax=Marinagarivorans algicola TaxID=1513270 RepID=UPI0006B9BD61|nr:class I SAM-dependent methyltransferase [Marinagarivorans algicola]